MNTSENLKNLETLQLKSEFSISRMEDIYENRKAKKSLPHRHNYYTVLIVIKADGYHIIDFNAYAFEDNQVFFVAPGQVHQVIENTKPYGYVITFSNQFLIENAIDLSFIDRLNLFNNYGQNPPLTPNRQRFEKIEGFCNQILTLFEGEEQLKYFSIGAYMKLLLIECNTSCQLNPLDSKMLSKEDVLLKQFKSLIEKHFKEEHSTQFYAEKLNITSDYLNRKIKAKIGKTAKEYIQTRITTEAKRLMYFSEMTTKEIGYELGFNEPSHFSSFFKNCTALSPTAFKNSLK